jgi:hypothetical protein
MMRTLVWLPLAACGAPRPAAQSNPPAAPATPASSLAPATATAVAAAPDASTPGDASGPPGCVDIPSPVSETRVSITELTADTVTFCNAADAGPWCARVSLADGKLTVLPPVPPSPASAVDDQPQEGPHINGDHIFLTTVPHAAEIRASGPRELEVCTKPGACRRMKADGAADASALAANADGSVVAMLESSGKVAILDATGRRLRRIHVAWVDMSTLHGVLLVGNTLIAWENPAGPMALGDLYATRSGKQLGRAADGMSLYGATIEHVRGDVWLFVGDHEDVVVQDVSTGKIAARIATSSFVTEGRSSTVDAKVRDGGRGIVLVSSSGDVAWTDERGKLGGHFAGPPPCTQ